MKRDFYGSSREMVITMDYEFYIELVATIENLNKYPEMIKYLKEDLELISKEIEESDFNSHWEDI